MSRLTMTRKRSTMLNRDSQMGGDMDTHPRTSELAELLQEIVHRPREERAGPTEVQVALYIDQIWDLDEKTESFKAKFTIFCRWRSYT